MREGPDVNAAGTAIRSRTEAASAGALEESELLERIKAQDVDAFERLYRLYQPRLARFLSNLLKRPQLVEEVPDQARGARHQGHAARGLPGIAELGEQHLRGAVHVDREPTAGGLLGSGRLGGRGRERSRGGRVNRHVLRFASGRAGGWIGRTGRVSFLFLRFTGEGEGDDEK